MEEQKIRQQAEQVVERIKTLVRDGSASRVILKRRGETLLNISLNTGIIGTVVGFKAAPFLMLTAALVSFGMDCEVEIEKKDGSILNLSDTPVGSKLESLKQSAKAAFASAGEKQPADVEIDPEDFTTADPEDYTTEEEV